MRDDKKRLLKRGLQITVSCGVALAIIAAFVFVTQGRDIPVLDPHGTIADQQKTLILITVALGVFVVVPVFVLLFAILWKYRDSNTKAKYEPELEGSKGLEVLWWGIPCLIILALAIITYISTHALDPYKALESDKTPIKVQVISTKWNWVFVYPDFHTATVNYMNIPENTPINLELTSDAPMNSFWVPALAGQVYTMNGMATKLHFMADKVGSYNGSTTNISGEAYADLRFKVNAMSDTDFSAWAAKAKSSTNVLNDETYEELSALSERQPETTYALKTEDLFNDVIMKYMHSGGTSH